MIHSQPVIGVTSFTSSVLTCIFTKMENGRDSNMWTGVRDRSNNPVMGYDSLSHPACVFLKLSLCLSNLRG